MKKYNQTLNKEEKVLRTFESIAAEYDRMNDLISLGRHGKWKKDLVKAIGSDRNQGILDVCCGTGDISLMLAKAYPEAKITGIDYSPHMLEIAEKRKAAKDIKNITFIKGNALELPFGDNSFSATVISFGLRNLNDYQKALQEMRRVTVPGGQILCLESSYPESFFIKPFFKFYFKHIMPTLAGILTRHKKQYDWLNQSTEDFLAKEELADLFKKSGLVDVGYRVYMMGGCALHYGRKLFK